MLIDTNVLLRHAESADPLNETCRHACRVLLGRNVELVLVPQVLYEFHVVATRPREQNGWGMLAREAVRQIDEARAMFPVLADSSAILDVWRALVLKYGIRGKRAHDARLVAAMEVHGASGLLTLNAADFGEFAAIAVLDPRTVKAV